MTFRFPAIAALGGLLALGACTDPGGQVALNVVDGMVFGWGNNMALFNPLYSLAVLVPSIAVGARRLHDTGRSGWWQLIWFIPIIGWIILIIWMASRGESRQNQYGPA